MKSMIVALLAVMALSSVAEAKPRWVKAKIIGKPTSAVIEFDAPDTAIDNTEPLPYYTQAPALPNTELGLLHQLVSRGDVGDTSLGVIPPTPGLLRSGRYPPVPKVEPARPLTPSCSGANVALAAKWLSWKYMSHQPKPIPYSQPTRQFGPDAKASDCSSFVQTALEIAGCGKLFGRSRAQTQAMRDVIKKLGGGYHQNPRVGDLVMWAEKTSGHVGVVFEDESKCGAGKASLIAMGHAGGQYTGCISIKAGFPARGAGAFWGFWTIPAAAFKASESRLVLPFNTLPPTPEPEKTPAPVKSVPSKRR